MYKNAVCDRHAFILLFSKYSKLSFMKYIIQRGFTMYKKRLCFQGFIQLRLNMCQVTVRGGHMKAKNIFLQNIN